MTLLRAICSVGAAAMLGLLTLVWTAPEYLSSRGYPLDDAWIYAVYGRSLAREGTFAYNPGIPATGATAPIWPFFIAGSHLIWSRPAAVVASVKLAGWMLHAVSALLILFAFRRSSRIEIPVVVGSLLVALHPDLISGSVSGMEVSLATTFAVALLWTARTGALVPYLIASFCAPLARPELGLVSLVLPVALYFRSNRRCMMGLVGAAALGTGLSFSAVAIRNLTVSGRPLVATFYAKAGSGDVSIPVAQLMGFNGLLGNLPIVDSSVLMCVALVAAIGFLVQGSEGHSERLAAAAFVTASVFCAVSFLLVRPVDPGAFYHQRYVLPVLPLFVVSAPVLLNGALKRLLPDRTHLVWISGAIMLLMVVSLVTDGPKRYTRLSNDAKNIDDIQVELGKSLAAMPADQSVWVMDAGAVRYFGSAFVVDLLGLNTDAMLGPRAQAFLDQHPPRFVEVIPGWSGLDDESRVRLRGRLFAPSTRYTVSGFSDLPMQRHLLMHCNDPSIRGTVFVMKSGYQFRCAD
jgi:hypothetical protein